MTYFNPAFTEEVAENAKWCPFARQSWGDDRDLVGVNRQPDRKPETFAPCVGDRCAAWRWATWIDDEGTVGDELKRGADCRPAEPYDGYCGLAGRPSHGPCIG